MTIKANPIAEMEKQSAWEAIISGLAASGELSPETLAQKGGSERVKILAVHAANLAGHFHAAYSKASK
jgi:hypothetical protein